MRRNVVLAVAIGSVTPGSGGAQQRMPRWNIDSTVDEMTDKRVTWVSLDATRPVASLYRTFTPSLWIICWATKADTGNRVSVRFHSGVSPSIGDVDPITATYIAIRFDSAETRDLKASIQGVGRGHFMEPMEYRPPRYSGDSVLHWDSVRDLLVGDLLSARRLLLRFQLISDENITSEFRLGAGTRASVKRVYDACKLAMPGARQTDDHGVALMKVSLHNLVSAQRALFADSGRYWEGLIVGGCALYGLRFCMDNAAGPLTVTATPDGFIATINNPRSAKVCAIFIGSISIAPAKREGEPACW